MYAIKLDLSQWARVISFLNIDYFLIVLSMIIHSSVGDHLFVFVSCVSHALLSCGHLWERTDLLANVDDVNCIFVTFPCGILDQVWYMIVSFPDLCRLSYFNA